MGNSLGRFNKLDFFSVPKMLAETEINYRERVYGKFGGLS
jgi:hypothetical protein